MTNLKSGRQRRKLLNSLSISSQSPQRSKDRWVDLGGGLTSSSTNVERAGNVIIESLFQKDSTASGGRPENWARSTMDRSDVVS